MNQKNLSELLNQTTWRRSDTDLPPKHHEKDSYSKTVLITDGFNIGIGYLEYINHRKKMRWFDDSDLLQMDSSGIPKVLYWMPLPDLPE